MKPQEIKDRENGMGALLSALLLFMAISCLTSVAGATYGLPAERSVPWQGKVGVKGDIPARTAIFRTLVPSGGDDAAAIQTAVKACPPGSVVKLKTGTFRISRPITLKAGTTLRGSGMGATTLQGVSGMKGSYLLGFRDGGASFDLSNAPHINLAGGFSKGSSTIRTASPHGWVAGDHVAIDQLNDDSADPPVSSSGTSGSCTWCGRGRGARSLGQTVKIVEVPSAKTAVVEIPLYWNFDAKLTPQGTKVIGVVPDTGLEELTLDNTLSGNSAQADDGTVLMSAAVNSWLLGVEVVGSYKNMVRVYGGYRNTIRGCKFHEGIPARPTDGAQYDTNRAYGVNMSQWLSACLIENNEFYHLAMSVVLDGPVSGNVIAYNYFHDNFNPVSWQQDAIAHHGGHPMMNLYEGNYAAGLSISADNIWGTSSHNTLFRNRVFNSTAFTSRTWAIDLYQKTRYYNLVGNVLGDRRDTIHHLDNADFSISNAHAIYKTGYADGGDSASVGNDHQVSATLLRHGNWDSVTNGVGWSGTDRRVLPGSLYLSRKPSWWGNLPWPAIGPDVSPLYPAAPPPGMGTPWGRYKPRFAPPVSSTR